MSSVNFEWHNDGHQIKVILERDTFLVTLSNCPNSRKPNTACWSERADGCLVAFFVDRYGMETNVGTAPASNIMDIAWSFQGDIYDLDASQVWIIPLADNAFSSWLDDQKVLPG